MLGPLSESGATASSRAAIEPPAKPSERARITPERAAIDTRPGARGAPRTCERRRRARAQPSGPNGVGVGGTGYSRAAGWAGSRVAWPCPGRGPSGGRLGSLATSPAGLCEVSAGGSGTGPSGLAGGGEASAGSQLDGGTAATRGANFRRRSGRLIGPRPFREPPPPTPRSPKPPRSGRGWGLRLHVQADRGQRPSSPGETHTHPRPPFPLEDSGRPEKRAVERCCATKAKSVSGHAQSARASPQPPARADSHQARSQRELTVHGSKYWLARALRGRGEGA